ncbi:hypothetical protein [Myxococcus sp. RHSTA-1-4]|uniref:hypothetical protein n=1 Tax=Myxococcus sp. RHSTA-1-4 TaxID=2874601 RepID=UPI001CBDA813|nr:hypothetical protein [Myxococcus sp. RHSTA-1-4]MBZ4422014.1 hypothetical protein [Myxococcus sp. RHSTA-1-4]
MSVPAHLLLPGGATSAWGGRPARTPAEVEYLRAVLAHARHRSELGTAAKADAEARQALLAATAEHGPCHPVTDAASRRWDAARKATQTASVLVAKAAERLARAHAAWAAEAAAASAAEAVSP